MCWTAPARLLSLFDRWHDLLGQQSDRLFVGGIQRFNYKVLDPSFNQHLVVTDNLLRRACHHEATPETGVALLQALRKVVGQSCLDVGLILSEDKPPRQMRAEYCLIKSSSLIQVRNYRKIGCSFEASSSKR